MVLAMTGVVVWVIAAAMMRRGTVPHAIGRMRPLGLSNGMTRAEARASRTDGGRAGSSKVAKVSTSMDKVGGVVGSNGKMFVPLPGWSSASVLGCVGQDMVYMVFDCG